MAARGCGAFGGAQNTAPPGSARAPTGDRGPEPGLRRENGSGPAGGAASPPPKPQRRGAGPPSHRGRGWSRAARGSQARTARGPQLGGFLFPRSKNASSFTGPRLQALAFSLPAQSSGRRAVPGLQVFAPGFSVSAGRPPPPGSLTGLPQGSGGRSAPGSASVRPTSCVGLSLRRGLCFPTGTRAPCRRM